MTQRQEKNNSLPEGWKRVRLGEVIEENPKSPFKVEDADNTGIYPFFTSGESVLRHSKYLVDGENLFLSTGGSFYIKYFVGKACYSADTYSLKSKIYPKFLYFHILNKTGNINFKYFSGSGLKHLQKKDFKQNFEVIFPENPMEQQKIAEILETVDKAIEKTDKIIEKYKKIKQGLMQDLLTKGIDENGKIRNPKTHKFKNSPLGMIPKEWEVVKLGDIGSIISGTTPKTNVKSYWGGDINWFTPEDLSKENKLFIKNSNRKLTIEGLKSCSLKIIPSNSVIISSRAPIGYIKVALNEFTINQGCKSIKVNLEMINSIFLAYLLSSKINEILNLGTGTTFQEISKSDLKNLLIPLPPLPEQRKIAEILSQIDKTIEKEQEYKEKLQKLKKGLMEDLLTGKVRVKV